MSALVALPVVIPLLTAASCGVLQTHRRLQRLVGVFGALALFASSIGLMFEVWQRGPLAAVIAGWTPPLGIALVADTLAAVMVLVTGLLGACVSVYALGDVSEKVEQRGYLPLHHVLLAGACGSFLTADLFNLFVWFEVLLGASFVLLVLERSNAQFEGAFKYVVINLIGSVVLLVAIGLTYGLAKTLNMADVATALGNAAAKRPALVLSVAGLYTVAFGIKAALFPLFAWLPPSYPTPPAAVAALFSGLLTKVGVYAFFRVFTLVLSGDERVYWVLLMLSCVTMVLGVAGAVAQSDVRRILSFHIISQIGYMVAGVGLLIAQDERTRKLALAAGIFYTIHNILAKSNLFLISGAIERLSGSSQLASLGGLSRRVPLWTGLFAISAFALAGMPPLSGFWAKLFVVWASVEAGHWWVGALGLLVGLFTLISMLKIFNGAFWKPTPDQQQFTELSGRGAWAMTAPVVVLASLSALVGVQPSPLFAAASRAAAELSSYTQYRAAQQLDPSVIATPEEVQ